MDFRPISFKCITNLTTWEEARSHWLHLFSFHRCTFSNVSSQMTCLRGKAFNTDIWYGGSDISWDKASSVGRFLPFSPLNLSVYIVNQSWIIFLSIFMKFLLKLWNVICYIWMIFFPMRFQKTLQIAWPRKQFSLIFATVHFKMSPQVACLTRGKVTWLHLFDFSPLCILKCLLKSLP